MSDQKHLENEDTMETSAPGGSIGPDGAEAEQSESLQAGAAVGGAPEAEGPGASHPSVLIGDPFGIKTLEISEAQESTDELDLDDDFSEGAKGEDALESAAREWEADGELADPASPESAAQLEGVARAVAEAEAANAHQAAEAAEALEPAAEFDSAAELARQIAEDQALAAELAREAEQAEDDPELLAALPKEPQPGADGSLDLAEMESCIETLLFMSDKPISLAKLREHLGPTFDELVFAQAIESLKARYQSPSHGIEVVEVGNAFQLRTKPGRAALAKKLAKIQTQRLSSGGMETLAIIAYKQPVMKEDIDKIRGVDSSYFIRGLLDRKLIKISGRSELPGRPMLYSTSDEFLQLFGIKDLASMPPLRELEQMIPASESRNPDDEDPRVREMRKLVSQMKSDNSASLIYDPREDEKILKEIRERVSAIPISTPYLDEQKAAEKAAQELLKQQKAGEAGPEQPELSAQEAPEVQPSLTSDATEELALPQLSESELAAEDGSTA